MPVTILTRTVRSKKLKKQDVSLSCRGYQVQLSVRTWQEMVSLKLAATLKA